MGPYWKFRLRLFLVGLTCWPFALTSALAQAPPPCSMTVFASGLAWPGPMIFKGTDLYVATFSSGTIGIVRITSAGAASVFATINAGEVAYPTDLALDTAGNIYVAGGNNMP